MFQIDPKIFYIDLLHFQIDLIEIVCTNCIHEYLVIDQMIYVLNVQFLINEKRAIFMVIIENFFFHEPPLCF